MIFLLIHWYLYIDHDHLFLTSREHRNIVQFNMYYAWLIPGDANSKLIEIVTVADLDDEKRVNYSLMQILKFEAEVWLLKLNFCSDWEHKVWSRFRIWSSGEILKLKFGQYFAADVWLKLWSWILVMILNLGLVKILSLSLDEVLKFGWDFEVNAYSIFWNWNFTQICV